MKKKGFVFTSIVIVVFLFLVVMNPSFNIDTRYQEIHKWQDLIENTNELLKEIESYQMPLVIRNIGYCALSEMASNPTFDAGATPYTSMSDINNSFRDYLMGSTGRCTLTLSTFLENLKEGLKIMNYNFTYSLDTLSVNISQNQPFKIRVIIRFPYNLSVVKNERVFSVERNISLNTTIPIIGIRDPLLAWATNGKYNITINVGPTEKIFDYEKEFGVDLTESDKALLECYKQFKEDIANKTCLEKLMEKKWFIYSPDAPSFLDRLLKHFGPSRCCGITTLLNESVIKVVSEKIRSSEEEGLINWSYADYCQYQENPTENCFFSNETCKQLVNESVIINGVPQDVLIDLYNYDIIMNLTVFAEKEENETIHYDATGDSCLSIDEIFSS